MVVAVLSRPLCGSPYGVVDQRRVLELSLRSFTNLRVARWCPSCVGAMTKHAPRILAARPRAAASCWQEVLEGGAGTTCCPQFSVTLPSREGRHPR
eukprot:6175559-Alexandrium_andersonii.AAC.1